MENELEIFSGNSNPQLALGISNYIRKKLGNITIRKFPNNSESGETHVKYEDNIRGKNVFLIQSLCDPVNENLMELLIMIDAAKRASAKEIIAVIPYYGYARQDRKDQPRVPITAKLVANLIETAGATKAITVDLHAHQIQGFFNIPIDHLMCSKLIARSLGSSINNQGTVLVAPDEGGMKLVSAYKKYLPKTRMAMISKDRKGDSDVEALFVVGDVEGKKCILIDDLTSTASTLVAGANKLMEKGAKSVCAAVSHCCLTESGFENIKTSVIKKLITTNTINSESRKRIKILDASEMIGEAITRCHDGRSITSLFDEG